VLTKQFSAVSSVPVGPYVAAYTLVDVDAGPNDVPVNTTWLPPPVLSAELVMPVTSGEE
jgi:hypothetical protein